MPSKHAILAPSASKRWMTCAPSARAESTCPEQQTAYTREGTVAHAVAEHFLREFDREALTVPGWDEVRLTLENVLDEEKAVCCELGADFFEMAETVWTYYCTPVLEDYLMARREDHTAELLVEAELNLASFIPEGFGSSDAVLIYGNTCHVYDLKYGKGVRVDANNNSQMMCYALGALYGPAQYYLIDRVEMTIIQPRLQHVSTFRMDYDSLVSWGIHILRPAAEKAITGSGEYVAGDHCKFCKFAPKCRACALRAKVVSEAYSQPEALSPEEIGEALRMVESIKTWAAHLEEYALQTLLTTSGSIPGWKVVEGRSIRKITDQQGCISELVNAGFDMDTIMKAPELKTISELEKMLGKAGKAIIAPYVTKPQGKPTLAPDTDSRQAFTGAKADFQ